MQVYIGAEFSSVGIASSAVSLHSIVASTETEESFVEIGIMQWQN